MNNEFNIKNTTPPQVTLRIGDEKRETGSYTHEHINPITGEIDATIPLAGAQEIKDAVGAAKKGFEAWRRISGIEKSKMLYKLSELILDNKEEFVRLGVIDNGTVVRNVAGSVEAASGWVRFYAGWADKLPHGRVNSTTISENELGYTLRMPYGVVGIIITWNAPLVSLCMKIPAALAAGNTVVVKPSELTPFSAMLFADLVERAGFPPGVVNILPGAADAGEELVSNKDVRLLSFTGGPITAKKIAQKCAETFKPILLELGGKSANIIFEDADLDEAVVQATTSALCVHSGQACALPTRILAQRSIYDELVRKVGEIASKLKIGNPYDSENMLGPVVNEEAAQRIIGMVDRAVADGARLITGGERLGGEFAKGSFVKPTVLADVPTDSEMANVEVFGPVLSIIPFHTEEEAIDIANSTEYGLSGHVWTRDIRKATRVLEQLFTGEVMVNGAGQAKYTRPFGGVGLSGIGREGGVEGLEEFLWTKSVALGGQKQ